MAKGAPTASTNFWPWLPRAFCRFFRTKDFLKRSQGPLLTADPSRAFESDEQLVYQLSPLLGFFRGGTETRHVADFASFTRRLVVVVQMTIW